MSSFGKAAHTTKWPRVRDLSVIWVNAQRSLDERWAQTIADNFDPDMFGVISVAKIGEDSYHVIDGQHRVAAVRLWAGENERVPCNVFEAKTPAEAAAMFDMLNTAKKALHNLDKFRVRVTAKTEPEFSVSKIVTSLGYTVTSGSGEGILSAVAACVASYKRYGETGLRDTLLIIQGCWGKEHHSVNAVLIRGFAEFLGEYGDEIDRQRLVDQVAKQYTPGRMIGAAKGAKEMYGGTVAACVSLVLRNCYNKGLRGKRLASDDQKAA